MTSQSEINSYGIWNNSDLWNNLNPVTEQNDPWSCNSGSNAVPSNLQGASNAQNDCDNREDPATANLWPSVGPIICNVNIPSIWANNDLFSCNDPNPSLSKTSTPWSQLSTDVGTGEISALNQHWDSSQQNRLRSNGQSDSWKSDVTLRPDAIRSVSDVEVIATASNNHVTQLPPSDYLTRTQPIANGSQQCLTTEFSRSAGYSTEQLREILINSAEGWGRRPIDQTTPWDVNEVASPHEHYGRGGLATPTPDSRTGGVVPSRGLENQPLESNVWTSEPPTGTGIWEMYYNMSGSRHTSWNANMSVCTTPSSSFRPNTSSMASSGGSVGIKNAAISSVTGFPRSVSQRAWDQCDKPWGSSVPLNSRPVLGGSRNGNLLEDTGTWMCNGPTTAESNQYTVEPAYGPGAYQWDSSACSTFPRWSPSGSSNGQVSPFMHNGTEDLRHAPVNHASIVSQSPNRTLQPLFSNSYRVDLVKCLMSHGFKKEDVLAALVDCNMDADRALQELRERFPNGYGFNSQPGLQPQANSINQYQTVNNATLAGGHGGANVAYRNRPLGASGVPSNNHSFLPSGSPANPHLIRQQLTQQVRSALNLSLPNHHGSANNVVNHSVLNSTGNSLLGQPPPLVSGTNGFMLGIGCNNSNSGASTTVPPHTRPICSNSLNQRFPSNLSSTRRSDRQTTIVAAIQELQKKHQSIQQQLLMYRNNPAICSQPQYVDVLTELQGQIQQIEAQLRAKQAQLNVACAQESAGRGQVLTAEGATHQPSNGKLNQDQLVQQLMELRIRSDTDVDGEFPTIGTWTAPTKSQDKVATNDVPASKPAIRSNGAKGGQNHFTGGTTANMQSCSSTARGVNGWANGLRRIDNVPLNGLDPFHSPLTGIDQPQLQSGSATGGQWLLIHPPLAASGGVCPNLQTLYDLLVPFGLTHFHLLNGSSASGFGNPTSSILIRLQSPECALQLIRAMGDRLSVEPITDPEALNQLHNDRFTSPRPECQFGQETVGSNMVGAPSATTRSDHHGIFSSQMSNSAQQLLPKRLPLVHGGSAPGPRNGVILSGFH